MNGDVTFRASYDEWHGRHPVDIGATAPWHQLVLKYLHRARDLEGKRVLEIGCGRGGLACRLAVERHRAACFVAADVSYVAVAKGRAFAIDQRLEGIHWALADIGRIAHPDSSFDTVISCETIEHLPNPPLALREIARVLRPGGRLWLTTPNYLGWLGLHRAALRLIGRRYTEEGQPINRFMVLPLTLMWVRRAGLRITTFESVGHYLYRPGRPPRELAALNGIRPLRWFGLHSLVVAEKP